MDFLQDRKYIPPSLLQVKKLERISSEPPALPTIMDYIVSVTVSLSSLQRFFPHTFIVVGGVEVPLWL